MTGSGCPVSLNAIETAQAPFGVLQGSFRLLLVWLLTLSHYTQISRVPAVTRKLYLGRKESYKCSSLDWSD